MILQGSFYGTVRSGHKGVRIVSMRRLIITRRCMTEGFAMAGERALLRFVNCWSMTGVFRRRSFRSGPRRDGGRVISRGVQGTPCCSMAGTATALRRMPQDVPGEQDSVQALSADVTDDHPDAMPGGA